MRDTAGWLIDCAGPLLPGRVVPRVQNAEGLRHGTTSELRAVLDGVSSEMIGWGSALGFARLLHVVEQLAPGATFPCVAYQAFCALSEAARGQLLCAVQTLPMTALLPASVQGAIGSALVTLLPARFGSMQGHQEVVIGLACCAVLYELGRHGPATVPASVQGQQLLHRLRQLRAAMNMLGGLQQLHNAASTAPLQLGRQRPAECGPRHTAATSAQRVPCLPPAAGNGVQRSGPWQREDAALPIMFARLSAAPGEALSGSASPFPGALAKSGKGNPAPAPKKPLPQRPPLLPRQSTRALLKIHRLQQRSQPRPAKAVIAGAGAGAADVGDANKDVLFSVMPGKRSESDTDHLFKKPKALVPPYVPPSSSRRPATGRPGPPLQSAAAAAPPLPTLSPPNVLQDILPSCIHFHHAQESMRQVRKARFDRQQLRFCVHDRARPAFETLFGDARTSPLPAKDWMLTLPIRERQVTDLRQAGIRKYSGLGQLHQMAPRDAVALGEDDVYAVATLSLVPDLRLDLRNVPDSRILAPNSFVLVTHTELDASERQFIAYFLKRSKGAELGLRAGFIEIAQDGGTYSIEDDHSGFVFSSTTLDDFVAGIEDVSGCRFRPDAVPASHPDRQPGWAAALPGPLGFFIRESDAQLDTQTDAPGTALARFNSQIHLLEPVRFDYLGGASGSLLRTCFTVVDRMVLLADADGVLRTLVFTSARPKEGPYTLKAYGGFKARLIHDLGLQPGRAYGMDEVIDALQRHGLTWLPADQAADTATVRPADMFQVQLAATEPPMPQVPFLFDGWQEPGTAPILSTFRVDENRVHYVDHDGSIGELVFVTLGAPAWKMQLSPHNEPAALAFARSNGIDPDHACAISEALQLLYSNGFVQVPLRAGH